MLFEAVVEIDEGVVRPQSLTKLVASGHRPGTLEREPFQVGALAVAMRSISRVSLDPLR